MSETAERIEDLERSIEYTAWLIAGELYFEDKFLRDRLVSMKAELAGLKSLNVDAAI